jgi:carbamoyltransferase
VVRKYITSLGIHTGHDSGAALVQNGKVLAAINEERIVNVKHYSGIPVNSIKEVFHISKVDPSSVDVISIVGITDMEPFLPVSKYPLFAHLYLKWNSITNNDKIKQCMYTYLTRFRKENEIRKNLQSIGVPLKKILFVEHHLAHAASAYYLSQYDLDEEVLVITSDAAGDSISSSINIGHQGKITRLKNSESTMPDSLGYFYGDITRVLGMKVNDDEYKVMGLAPYGKSEYCLEKMKQMIGIDKSEPLKIKNKLQTRIPLLIDDVRELLKEQRFDNIAAASQLWFETLITEWISNAIKKTGIQKLACAGGTFLNVKANKKILEIEEVNDAFFCPASGDAGTAVGAALEGYFGLSAEDGTKPQKVPIKDIYWGTSFTNEQIKDSLKTSGLLQNAEYIDDIDEEIGELIAKPNVIVARFNGRMEWGPRGLGNRSILANPTEFTITRSLNQVIKMRDFWMPFAPSILTSRIDDYLVNGTNSPYMIHTFDTTDKRNDLSAAIHPYDFTCRPQTVDSNYNVEYEKVLKSFESKTGIGGILNTSFNLHRYPIVHNPDLAIWTFNNCKLEYMALGNYLIKK